MTRHELNDVFATTSFLQGANAAYLEQLHASYEQAPDSVGPEWQAFFASLRDDKDDVLFQARGPSWKPSNGLEGKVLAPAAFTEEQALAAARDTLARPHADPQLPHPRPSHRQARSARALDPQGASGAQAANLRLHQGGLRPADLSRRRARPRVRHAPPSPRYSEARLRPAYRHGVHAYLRSRATAVDPGPARGT